MSFVTFSDLKSSSDAKTLLPDALLYYLSKYNGGSLIDVAINFLQLIKDISGIHKQLTVSKVIQKGYYLPYDLIMESSDFHQVNYYLFVNILVTVIEYTYVYINMYVRIYEKNP